MPKAPTSAPQLDLKPNHAPVKAYYQVLAQLGQLNIDYEMAVRSAFQGLLSSCARKFQWTVVPEYPIERPQAPPLRVDAAVLDTFRLKRGLWEAKDSQDDLEKEIAAKLAIGYPKDNIIFQAPERAVLYQNGARLGLNEDIRDPKNLVALLKQFFEYRLPHHEEWESAVAEFKAELPTIAGAAKELIEKERRTNPKFVASFDAFYALCRQAINPNLSAEAVEGMLIQHLLTERIFRKIFDNPDFARRNVVAIEIEKVIDSLTSRAFNRDAFLKDLDHFYKAIELNAENATGFSEKQQFLNSVYERFFQGYSPKEADTHGIVYTPQQLVSFMVRGVEDILQKEFGKSLSDKDVHIIDPFVGTGNFIVRVMAGIKTSALPYKYEHELHCNEVMLLPYYIASMNIEHAYFERTGEYKPFSGICLVDTFELAEPKQSLMFTEENATRVQKQRQAPIFVIIGNPPYNAQQVNENDNNKNRLYPKLDSDVAKTYAKASGASLKTKYRDPYIKAIRWATDRLSNTGVVAFVTNDSFVDDNVFDGIRKHLQQDFDSIYVLDLGGNAVKNPKLSGTTHNVFGIPRGVSINFFVRSKDAEQPRRAQIRYAKVDEYWRKEQKYDFLDASEVGSITWQVIEPDEKGTWLTGGLRSEFGDLIPLGTRESKAQRLDLRESVFSSYSLGVSTNRDRYVYGFDSHRVLEIVGKLAMAYNAEIDRWKRLGKPENVDDFVDSHAIKWSNFLKRKLTEEEAAKGSAGYVAPSIYRPFTKTYLHFDKVFVDAPGLQHHFFPTKTIQNSAIFVSDKGFRAPFSTLMIASLGDLHLCASEDGFQCFPFYTFDEDGSNRLENITDWALEQFRSNYKDKKITKGDIFYYIYTVLHHPEYRGRYAANLKRELPRIPFAPDFWPFAEAGKKLADLHVAYEKQREYPLERIEKPGEKLDWRVQRMRLSKDKTTLHYNDFLTLKGIPPEAYEYRLGNRSAFEWVIDQYQVSTDKRSGIANDPNRDDDPQYILRLVGQVITVSIETMKVVKSLPHLGLPDEKAEAAPA